MLPAKGSARTATESASSPCPWWKVGASRWDLAVVLVAAAARATHLGQLLASPFAQWLVGDGAVYDAWAREVLAGDWLSRKQGVFYQSPLYPYFLAGVYAIFGPKTSAVFAFQALLGVVACVFLARATRIFFGARAGLFAGLFLALYGPAVFYEGVVQKAALDTFLLSALWFVLARAESGFRVGSVALAGCLTGFLIANRENAAFLAPLVLLWLWWRAGATFSRRVRGVAVFALGLALPLGVIAVRNLAVGGVFALTTTQFGPNFYIGNNPQASGLYQPLLPGRGNPVFEREDARKLAEQALGRPASPGEVSHFWTREALRFIFTSPGQWVALLGKKLLLAVNHVEVADVDDFYGRLRELPTLHLAFLRLPWVFALGAAGWWAARQRWRELLPFFAGAPLYLASVALFFVLGRYRYPLVLFLLPFAGFAFGLVTTRSPWRAKGGLLLVVAAAFGLTQIPLVERRFQECSSAISLGDYYFIQKHQPELALHWYRKAVSLAPESAEAHLRLAQAAAAGKQEELAEQHFAEAAQRAPGWSEVFSAWGRARWQRGDVPGAAVLFAKACQLPGASGESFRLLGDALFKLGRTAEAVTAYEQAWRMEGGAVVANNLGAAFAQLRRFQEAERFLREAAALDTRYAQPWMNLAKVFLVTGRPAEARAALAKARTLAPDHPELPQVEARLRSSSVPPREVP